MTHREELALSLDLPCGRRRQPKLGRGMAWRGPAGHRSAGPGPSGASRRLRRSTVKAAYSPNRRPGQWQAHGRYLARPGAQRPAGQGVG